MSDKELSRDEIKSARFKYIGTMTAILKDILVQAHSAKRDQVVSNTEHIISHIAGFKDWIKGYEHNVNIPRE